MNENEAKLDIKQADDRAIEKRTDDRRQSSVRTLAGAIWHQRRRNHRRDNDHVDRYIDWYGHWPFAAILTITLLCFADAFLTIVLLSKGAVELNILMDWLIQRDVHTFTVVKMAVTGAALLVLVMHFNFRIYRFIAVRYLIYALVPMYSLLIAHEINMIANL